MTVAKDPNKSAEKWARGLQGASQSIKDGVQSVQTSPMEAAARNEAGYLNGIQNAVSSGKWQRGLRRRSLADWQNAMVQKGIPRVASGATAAVPKMAGFLSELLPFQQALRDRIKAMPNATPADRDARMLAMASGMRQFKRSV